MLGACVCLLRLFCACSHHHLPQTQSFLFLVSRGSGKGWAGKLLSSSVQALVPSQGQVPACPRSPTASRCCQGGTGQPWAAGQPGSRQGWEVWDPSSHLACGGRQGHCVGAGTVPQRSPGAGWGFWSPVLFRPQHSCPRLSESPGPTPCTSGWPCGERPRIPLPRLGHQHLEGGESRDEGTWDPFPAAGSPSQPEQAHSRCAFQMPVHLLSAPAPPPNPVLFPREREGWKERGGTP